MKKNNLFKFLAATVVSSTLFLACNKDDNPTPIPDTVQKLLHDWEITAITTPKKLDPTADSIIIKPCMGDDTIRFSLTGFDFRDGVNKCDSTIFPYGKGDWAYDLAKDSIRLGSTTPQKYLSWKVLTLNDSVLQVKYIDSISTDDHITKTISFKH